MATRVSAIYFSATGTTEKVVKAVAKGTGLPCENYAVQHIYNPPQIPKFGKDDLVVIGAPVYVGRVPMPLLKILGGLEGDGTPCIIIGVYGNRNYDDFLVELEDIAISKGFCPVGGAAFIGEHSFSKTLAGGRPNVDDLAVAEKFGQDVAAKLQSGDAALELGTIAGSRPYRDPYGGTGKREPMGPSFTESCAKCGICVEKCPTGAISQPGTVALERCIRCYACVKGCPCGAAIFTNEQFLGHVAHLEKEYASYKAPEIFI